MKPFSSSTGTSYKKSYLHAEPSVQKATDTPARKSFFAEKVIPLFLILMFIGAFAEAATRTYEGPVATAGVNVNWNDPSNWNGGLTAPSTGDDIVFSKGTVSFSVMPLNIAYNSISITQGIITLANSVPTTLTIGGNVSGNFGGGAGTDLYINGNRQLVLGNNVNITLTLNSTATLNGQLIIFAGCIYDTEQAVTTVSGASAYIDNVGTVTCTNKNNLNFFGSTYYHKRNGGTIPIATWDPTSTCSISLAPASGPTPASLEQVFGNLIWDCQQTYIMTIAPIEVKGKLEIKRTGSSEYPNTRIVILTKSGAGPLAIGGTLFIGGYVTIEGNTVNALNTTIIRYAKYNNAVLTVKNGILNTSSFNVGPFIDFGYEGDDLFPATGVLFIGGTVNINSSLTIHPACTFRSTNTPSINIKGNLNNNGNYLKDQETVTFNGSTPQNIQGTSVTTFYNLNINNSAGVTLQSDAQVSNTLSFLNGKITTGLKTLTLDLNATPISGAGAGKYVFGNLGISIPPNTTSKTFTIGDATNYTPVTLSFMGTPTNSIGNIVARTTIGDHPGIGNTGIYGIDPTKSLNRYFTLTNNGVTFGTYSASFTFNPSDLDVGTDPLIFMVQRFSPNSWYSTNIGTRTLTTIQFTGGSQTDFGDFQAGQMKCAIPLTNAITGGGSFCVGNTGAVVGLSGSEAGVNYQLRVNGVNTGSPVPGGGTTINFGNQAVAGTYTVLAFRVLGGCYNTMSNPVTVP